jgi:hypothetical protein
MSLSFESATEEVLRLINRAEVFADLDPQDKGNALLCLCPGCNQRSAFIYKNGVVLICQRLNQCGYKMPILSYINGGSKPTGDDFKSIIRRYAERLGIPLAEQSPESQEAARKATERAERLESALAEAHNSIGAKVVDYLEQRGYKSPGVAIHSDIGYVANEETAKALSGYEVQEGDKKPWRSWIGRMVMAIRNRQGRLTGFIARTLNDDPIKYLYSKGLQLNTQAAIGLDQALANGNTTIVLVEAVFEVYLARSYGYNNFAAIGGATLSADRLRQLYDLGVRKIFALFDNDLAGQKGQQAIVDALTSAKQPDVYVPSLKDVFGRFKDLGEIVQTTHNLSEPLAKLSEAQHAYRFKAQTLADLHDLMTDEGRNNYIKAAYKYDSGINDPAREDELDSYFWPEVCRLSGRDIDYILNVRDDVKKAERYEQRQRSLSDALRKSQESFLSGDLSSAMTHLGNAYRSACESITDVPYAPIVPISERLAENSQRLADRVNKQYLGLVQKTIPELDEATLGLRRMIAVAAGPGVGKTIFLSQVIQDVLTHNQDTCAVLVSWELTGDEIIDRMKSRALRVNWSDLQLRSTPEMREKADHMLRPIADRLVIIESANCAERELTAQKVISIIDETKRRTGCKHCIVGLDYIQIFPVPEEIAASRSDLGRDDYIVGELKKIRYHLGNDPMIAISEVTKMGGLAGKSLDKLKGSGRVVYSSDAVFFLNQLSDEDLVKHVQLNNGIAIPVGRYGTKPEIKKGELATVAAEIRASLLEQGKDYLELSIAKIRDGGKRLSILLCNEYEYSRMESVPE